jgi:hypothetical protein
MQAPVLLPGQGAVAAASRSLPVGIQVSCGFVQSLPPGSDTIHELFAGSYASTVRFCEPPSVPPIVYTHCPPPALDGQGAVVAASHVLPRGMQAGTAMAQEPPLPEDIQALVAGL